jgi:succinate-semialdehyde dehydrogenase/glutarate-semialdehyde dehydrogenase
MPWNFPFWQVFRFAVPNLAAGNGVVLKHSPNTTGTAEMIEEIFLTSGFPQGAFQNLIISNEQASKVIADERIKGVTFTGSNKTGSIVAQQAGKHLKKTVLELGGNDAYIVLNDVDVEKAAEICVTGRMINSGQSCIAAKRFIVDRSIKKEFTDAVVEKMKEYHIGDPMSCSVNFGPIAREDLRDELHDQVKRSIEAGAELLLGGEIPERKGYYYPATVLSNVKPGMACFDEETFGPIASITYFDMEEEAIELANNSIYGLGSAVLTSDRSKGEKIAKEKLNAGSAFVNDFVKSDPRLPFGGIKQSGYGRELSLIGMHEFVNAKTVCIK